MASTRKLTRISNSILVEPTISLKRKSEYQSPERLSSESKPVTRRIRPKTRKSTKQDKAARTIQSFFKQTKHTRKAYFLKALCSDAGVCLAFGTLADSIKAHFNGYTKFDYVVPPIKRIGESSVNGFINQIEYEHRGYKSYAILKSAKTADADNLLYEYIVGQYINRLNKQYPCFLETYGYYFYNKNKYREKLQNDKLNDVSVLKKGLILHTDPDYHYGCKSSKNLAILIQHLNNIKSLDKMSRDLDFIQNDLMWVLFQLYMPLAKLKNSFTHYDLHLSNVYLYEPVAGKYIEYHYFLTKTKKVSFKSSYMLKIIDYGRSYFNDKYSGVDSKQIYEAICAEDECNEPEDERGVCGSSVGFAWLEPLRRKAASQFYISAQRKNISHDLLPLVRIKENNTAPKQNFLTPELNELVNEVVYLDYYGTKERIETGAPGYILNVRDAAKKITNYIMRDDYRRKNEEVNAGKEKLGDLYIYMDGRPMDFVPL
jgi:hypothetical protein